MISLPENSKTKNPLKIMKVQDVLRKKWIEDNVDLTPQTRNDLTFMSRYLIANASKLQIDTDLCTIYYFKDVLKDEFRKRQGPRPETLELLLTLAPIVKYLKECGYHVDQSRLKTQTSLLPHTSSSNPHTTPEKQNLPQPITLKHKESKKAIIIKKLEQRIDNLSVLSGGTYVALLCVLLYLIISAPGDFSTTHKTILNSARTFSLTSFDLILTYSQYIYTQASNLIDSLVYNM